MIACVLLYQKKTVSLTRDTLFVILISVLINSHFYLGILETLKLIKTTTDPKLYIVFLLYRSVIAPLSISYCLNIFQETKWKIPIILGFVTYILLMEQLGEWFGLYEFLRWNLFFSGLYYLCFFFLLSIFLRWFKKIEK